MSSEKGVEKRHKRKRGNDGERYNDEKSCCRKRECKGCTGVGRHRERRCRSSSSSATHERDSELHSRRDGDGRDNCHWEVSFIRSVNFAFILKVFAQTDYVNFQAFHHQKWFADYLNLLVIERIMEIC